MYWQRFFEIYGFTQDREDSRVALMLSVLTWVSGRTLKKPIKQDEFMPRFVNERKPSAPSLEQQKNEFAAFVAKLKAVQG